MPLFADSNEPLQVEQLSTGALRLTANLARTGIQEYGPHLFEESRGKFDRKIRIYRPASAVFDPESLDTVRDKPVTIGHPKSGMIDEARQPGRLQSLQRGHASSADPERVKDGAEEWLRTRIIVSGGDAIAGVKSKALSKISQGYHATLDWTPGKTANGESYDAIVTRIVHNHTALLGTGEARAGDGARIFLDSAIDEEYTMTEDEKKALIAEAVAAALEAFREEQKKDDEDEADKPADKPADEPAADVKDGKAIADAVQGAQAAVKAITDAFDARVSLSDAAERTKGLLPTGYAAAGKTAAQLKLAALRHVMPALALADSASDDEINGAFSVLESNRTKFFDAAKSGVPAGPSDHVKAYNARMAAAFAGVK